LAFAESIFKKKYFENNKILEKSILKIQNKILFGIFKIKYYFENTILHITGFTGRCRMSVLSGHLAEISAVYARNAMCMTLAQRIHSTVVGYWPSIPLAVALHTYLV